jgi:hypothetical protein
VYRQRTESWWQEKTWGHRWAEAPVEHCRVYVWVWVWVCAHVRARLYVYVFVCASMGWWGGGRAHLGAIMQAADGIMMAGGNLGAQVGESCGSKAWK